MYRTQGIIVATEKLGETDQLVSIFSKDFGKLKAVAQGSLKHDSKMRSIVQVGHAIDFVMLPLRSGRYRLTSPSIIDAFSGIRNDTHKLPVKLFSLGLLDQILHEGERDEKLWTFLVGWLSELGELQMQNKAISERGTGWFLAHLLSYLGGLNQKESEKLPGTLREALLEESSGIEWGVLRRAYQTSLGFSLPEHFLLE